MNYLRETAQQMADSLMDEAKQANIDLTGLTIDNFNGFLDDAFDDGGETRCERFADLAWEYAMEEGGPFASRDFEAAQWEAIEIAIQLVNRQVEG